MKCEGPTDKIYQFDGVMELDGGIAAKISINYENFLLRGASLR